MGSDGGRSAWAAQGLFHLDLGEVGSSGNGELEEEQMVHVDYKGSEFGAREPAIDRRLNHVPDRDRGRDTRVELGRGIKYKSIRAEWGGIL